MGKRFHILDLTTRRLRRGKERWTVVEAVARSREGILELRPVPEEMGYTARDQAQARARRLEQDHAGDPDYVLGERATR